MKIQEAITTKFESLIEAELEKNLSEEQVAVLNELLQMVKVERFGMKMALDDMKAFEKSPNIDSLKSALKHACSSVLETFPKILKAMFSPVLDRLQKAFVFAQLKEAAGIEKAIIDLKRELEATSKNIF